MLRRRISRKGSRKLFSKTARKVKRKNMRGRPMRGGFRI